MIQEHLITIMLILGFVILFEFIFGIVYYILDISFGWNVTEKNVIRGCIFIAHIHAVQATKLAREYRLWIRLALYLHFILLTPFTFVAHSIVRFLFTTYDILQKLWNTAIYRKS